MLIRTISLTYLFGSLPVTSVAQFILVATIHFHQSTCSLLEIALSIPDEISTSYEDYLLFATQLQFT